MTQQARRALRLATPAILPSSDLLDLLTRRPGPTSRSGHEPPHCPCPQPRPGTTTHYWNYCSCFSSMGRWVASVHRRPFYHAVVVAAGAGSGTGSASTVHGSSQSLRLSGRIHPTRRRHTMLWCDVASSSRTFCWLPAPRALFSGRACDEEGLGTEEGRDRASGEDNARACGSAGRERERERQKKSERREGSEPTLGSLSVQTTGSSAFCCGQRRCG